jgi:hypothetical protein
VARETFETNFERLISVPPSHWDGKPNPDLFFHSPQKKGPPKDGWRAVTIFPYFFWMHICQRIRPASVQ